MIARPQLTAVTDAALEPYPIDRAERLDAHAFVKWQHHRWLASRTFKLASWEVQGMARALFDLAQTESPVGTLPNDDEELAIMLRVEPRRLRELRKQDFGPLRGWRPCLCGNEVRLMHPVVLEQVQDALERREIRQMSTEKKAEYQRIKRLREGLASIGLGPEALADEVLISRMDAWLCEKRPGRRTRAAYEDVMVQAQRAGWLGR